nr:hypothetical protein [Tanacetum cinerariifolium]
GVLLVGHAAAARAVVVAFGFHLEGIGPEAGEGVAERVAHGVDGREDAYKRHQPDADDEGRENGAQQIAPDGAQGFADVF